MKASLKKPNRTIISVQLNIKNASGNDRVFGIIQYLFSLKQHYMTSSDTHEDLSMSLQILAATSGFYDQN